MDRARQVDLQLLLARYFDGASFAEGVEELTAISARNPSDYRRHRAAVRAGIDAADAGDEDVLAVVRDHWPSVSDVFAAAAELRRLLDAYDRGVEQRGLPPRDWRERRSDNLRALAKVTATRRGFENDGSSGAAVGLWRRRETDLRGAYAEGLPPMPIARDPFTRQLISVRMDVAGLDGPYWDAMAPARPFEPLPATYVVHSGAMALEVLSLENTIQLCSPGPPVPYVVPTLLEREGVLACLSTLAVGAHRGFVVTYFSLRGSEPSPLTNEWGANYHWLRREGEPVVMAEAYDTWPAIDFELAPWVARGKLRWVAPADRDWRLRTGTDDCPYLDMPGRRAHQRLQIGKVW